MASVTLIFYGPSRAGKTTIFKSLYQNSPLQKASDAIMMADKDGRTIYFDYAPFYLQDLEIKVYTVAGDEARAIQRKILLNRPINGFLFVVDSTKPTESIRCLQELQHFYGGKLGEEIPVVYVLNKRDLPDSKTKRELVSQMKLDGSFVYETVATTGQNVLEAFYSLLREVLLKQMYNM